MQADPLAEMFENLSSFAAMNNNPMRFIDPTGMAPDTNTYVQPEVLVTAKAPEKPQVDVFSSVDWVSFYVSVASAKDAERYYQILSNRGIPSIDSDGSVRELKLMIGELPDFGVGGPAGKAKKLKDLLKAIASYFKTGKVITAPKGWISIPTKGKGGTIFKDPHNPHNSIRVMPGNPSSPNPAQQKPYVKFQKNSVSYDGNGNALLNNKDPKAHIPLKDFDMNKMPRMD
jgi:hypothetical protein